MMISAVSHAHNIVLNCSKYSPRVFHTQLQSLYRGTCCNLSNGLENKIDQINTEPVEIPYHLKPFANQTTSEVLSSVKMKSYFDSVSFLKALRVQVLLNKTNVDIIKQDLRFERICKVFEKQCRSLNPFLLVSGLRSLLEIGVSPDSNCVKWAEQSVLAKLPKFDMISLISCLHLLSKMQHTDTQKVVVTALVEAIQERISEVQNGTQAIMLMQMLHLFEQQHIKTIETKMVEISGSFNVQELSKIICLLGEKSYRIKPLLNAISFHFRQKIEKPNIKTIVDILYALNALNFAEPALLYYLTEDRISEISAIEQSSLISGLLTVFGHLKWRHSDILDACGQWILKNIEICTTRELVSYVLTVAALNYAPSDSSLLKDISSHLSLKKVGSRAVWLDVVWSLGILDCIDKDLLDEVLNKEFYLPLIDGTDFRSISNKLKLINLKSVLKNNYPEFVFSCNLFLEADEIPRSTESMMYRNTVINALSNFVPTEKYMCSYLSTDMGLCIDAEFIIDSKGKPLPLSEYGLKAKPSIVTKVLPPGAKRIALMIWLYKDFTLNQKSLIGINALAVRLLSKEGYVVVQVPYKEFSKNITIVKKVTYLVDLINQAIVGSKEK